MVVSAVTAPSNLAWEIPLIALREALINALLHRDYTALSATQVRLYPERLVIINVGGLHEGISIADLFGPHSSLPRNPLLASIAHKMELIESWGTGTVRIVEQCKLGGLATPEFTSTPGFFTVTFFRGVLDAAGVRARGLSERQVQAFELVQKEGKITNAIYRKRFGVSDETARNELNELVAKRILQRIGAGKSVSYILA